MYNIIHTTYCTRMHIRTYIQTTTGYQCLYDTEMCSYGYIYISCIASYYAYSLHEYFDIVNTRHQVMYRYTIHLQVYIATVAVCTLIHAHIVCEHIRLYNYVHKTM